MHIFEVHSNESACRKSGRLGLEQVIWVSQLAEIEAVRTIFSNWRTVESLPPESHKVLPHPTPVLPRKALAPVQYPTPTSKGVQEKKRVLTSKGVLQQKPLTIPKNTQVEINSKGDQEPIAKRTRYSIDSTSPPSIQAIQPLNEPIVEITRSRKLSHKYTTPSHSKVLAAYHTDKQVSH